MEEKKIGKFNSTEDLLNAYNALEAEFTKRCQRLKETERLLNEAMARFNEKGTTEDENNPAGMFRDNAAEQEITARANLNASEFSLESPPQFVQAELVNFVESDEFIDDVILKSEKILKAVVFDYLQKIKNSNNGFGEFLSAGIGRAALTPVNKPKSLSEAKTVADRYLRGLNQ